MSDTTIDIYDAIDRMRTISANGGTFHLKFRKWNRATNRGGDLANVQHARLRPKAADEDVVNASYKLFFTDTDTGVARNCWQMLVVEFNGQRTTLQ